MTWVQDKLNDHLTKRGVRLSIIEKLLPQAGTLRVYNGAYDPTARISVLFCLDYTYLKDATRAKGLLMDEGFSRIEMEKEGRKILVWPNEDQVSPKSVFLLTLEKK